MSTSAPIKGQVFQGDTPDWRPILRVMDEELVGSFMWMFEVRTQANKPIHAYKHRDTRRYVHLDRQGQAYTYLSRVDAYRSVPLADAVEHVFGDWRSLGATVREARLASQAVLEARTAGVTIG